MWSESPWAQPLNKIVAIARAISPGLQHSLVCMSGPLEVLQALGSATGLLAAAPRTDGEQDNGGGEDHQGNARLHSEANTEPSAARLSGKASVSGSNLPICVAEAACAPTARPPTI